MESFGIGGMAGLGALGAAGVLATALRVRLRRRRAAARKAPAVRLESLAAAQAELAARLDGLAAEGGAEAKLQAMAGQLLTLIRDKNAAMETAMAGLDQLRARLRALEQIGEPAEARALLDKLGERLDTLQTTQAAGAAALEARLGALERPGTAPVAALAERLAKLHDQKDAGLAAALGRFGPLEAKLAALEGELAAVRAGVGTAEGALARLHDQKDAGLAAVLGRLGSLEQAVAARAPQAGLDGVAGRLEAALGRLAALEDAENPFAEISEQLTRLYGQKDAAVETVLGRLTPLEAKLAEIERGMAGHDPRAALDGFAARLEAVQGRLGALEDAENPFAEISEQLTRLYGQKDAAVETVLGRLTPLEAKLAEIERGMAGHDPRAALDGFAARLEAVQGRLGALEDAENPFAEISEQLTRLYGQKDAAVETVLGRLTPLEAKLAEIERGMAGHDPRAALDGFAARLEAVQGRLGALEDAENPFAEISEQLTRLYGQKDAAVETVLGRLTPLEAKLAEIERGMAGHDPRAALDGFAARLEAVQGRLGALEDAENPFAEISEQLTRLYGQKDAAVETVLGRLTPLEAKLAEIERGMAGHDPRAALDGFAARLEAVQGRLGALEDAENPFAEISEQLTRLYGQKDAAVETVLGRLTPLEAKLGEIEGGLARLAPLAEADPRAEIDGLAARLSELHWAQGEVAAGLAALKAAGDEAAPFGAIADQLTRLYAQKDAAVEAVFAQKDAAVEAVFARLAPLEARLAELEGRPWDPAAEEARAQAQAIAAQLIAVRAAAEQTGLFADRLALLEASLPRLSTAQTLLMQVLERQAAAARATGSAAGWGAEPLAEPAPVPAPASASVSAGGERPAPADPAAGPAEPAGDLDDIWSLPRLISLHRK